MVARGSKQLTSPMFWLIEDKIILPKKISTSLPAFVDIPNTPSVIRSDFMPYVHKSITVQASKIHGKGLFSSENISSGTEIMRIPALVSYGGNEPDTEKVLKAVYHTVDTLNKAIESDAALSKCPDQGFGAYLLYYYRDNVLSLMSRGWKPLSNHTESNLIREKGKFLYKLMDKLSIWLQPNNLASIYLFNKFEATYAARKYFAVFPAASLFNHDCSPNIEIEIIPPANYISSSVSSASATCVLIARTCRKVIDGEELFISYVSEPNQSIVEKGDMMRRRWGFQCLCKNCRFRMMIACYLVLVIGLISAYFGVKYMRRRIHGDDR